MVVLPRRLFQSPWEFREAAIFTAVAVIAGFAVQYAGLGIGVPQPHLPYNALFLGIFAVAIISAGVAFRNNAFVKWLGGIPLGLSLICAIALLSLIGGIIPQTAPAPGSRPALLGLNQIFSSWPFALTILLFLANLGLSLSWKLVPFKVQNLQFILFHAGFWIALSCAILGAPDLQRLVVPVEEGKASNLGYTMDSETPQILPFSVFLRDFSLEEYPPQLLLFEQKTGKIFEERSKANILVHKGLKASWKGVDVDVLDFMPYALPGKSGVPESADRTAGIPFAKIRITSTNATVREEWITTGSPFVDTKDAQAGSLSLGIRPGTPKAFRSEVTVQDETGNQSKATLEVNHPINFVGWKLYQMGYDQKAGRWSKVSLIEVIRDPWLPAVYLGFFMIMAGNILFFWNGIKRTEGAS